MIDGVAQLPFIVVANYIAERVSCLGKFPVKDLTAILRVRDNRGIIFDGVWSAVHTHQPILTANFPVISLRVDVVLDAGKESFGARTITNRLSRFDDGH